MPRFLRRCLIVGVCISGFVFVLWLATGRPRTPRISGATSVASLEPMVLGGVEQWVLIRGRDRRAPILLFLHGGPGMPAMYLHHACGRSLEDDFLVVHWDQRGAGKSYSPDLDPQALSVEQVLDDAVELIGALRDRFGPEPVVLVGHSWGSYLGAILARRHPELFRAYIGIGQVTDPEWEAALADEFIRTAARERGLPEAADELEAHGEGVREKWLFELGGELYGETSFLPLILTGLQAPEYSWPDAMNVAKGSSWSSRHMQWNALDGPLTEEVLEFEIPVFFFLGRHDWVTPSSLAIDYLERIDAPMKEAVWFEQSAHFAFFEQPEEFARQMRRVAEEASRAASW